jgi:hypothetical protein
MGRSGLAQSAPTPARALANGRRRIRNE